MLKLFRVPPRDMSAADFPKEGTTRERMMFLLRFAILAPSIHNTQPWKFSVDRHRIGIFADRARWLAVADPDQRDLRLSLGCVIESLLVVARHFGYAPEVTYAPRASSPDLIATVDLSRFELPRKRPGAMLEALKRRSTTYRASESRRVTPSLLKDLSRAASGDDSVLFVTGDAGVRSSAAELFRRANALQFADPGFRDEIAKWLRRGEYGLPRVLTYLKGAGVRQIEKALAREAELIAAAPYFGAILSEKNDVMAQVRAGQAFGRLWLAAVGWNVSLRPASVLCEVPAVKAELARLVDAGDRHVQLAFRLGYGEARGRRTPRRKIDDSIIAISLT